MVSKGADLIDIGGESTRPGAVTVAPEEEIQRTAPVIQAIREAGVAAPISIDTRKSAVGRTAICAGANIVNDVSGFTYDLELAANCGKSGTPVCLMHAQGDPATMQDEPQYDDVLLDVYDFLETQIDVLLSLGIRRSSIIADPGIGFGKSQSHNLKVLSRISLFHSLGVPILLGASRKRFIGSIGDEPVADKRVAGSVGVALAAIGQGVQLIRAHDIAEHQQAIALWQASVTQDLNEIE
jgi:dihydropteroate synthase